jgi:chemotaxis protein methyltransferase CheR
MSHELSHIHFIGVAPAPRGVFQQSSRRAFANSVKPGQLTIPFRRDHQRVEIDPFLSWLLARAGLNARAYRASALQRRLPACLRKLRVSCGNAARTLLEEKPQLIPAAVSTLLIGVTDFFRDQPVFDHLAKLVLPELLQSRDGLRVCSAGVSDGRELYSMAMLLAETGALDKSHLLGVDCRADAIAEARGGGFGDEEVAEIPIHRRERHFRRENSRWIVASELRAKVQWQVGDLFALEDGRWWDVILFRNVAIYFEEAHGAMAWEKLCSQLVAGGFLITGKAEKPPKSLPLRRVAASVYRKVEA